MKVYEATLESKTPIIFSRQLIADEFPKLEREQADEYDKRLWREKAHYTADNQVFIPAVYFKRALEEVAKFLGIQIPGKGKSTYTKHFLSGVQIIEDMALPEKKDDVKMVPISCNADGRRGSGARVLRRFPSIPKWSGKIKLIVVDEIITEPVLREHLTKAGMLIGIGSFRIAKGNSSGGFTLTGLKESSL